MKSNKTLQKKQSLKLASSSDGSTDQKSGASQAEILRQKNKKQFEEDKSQNLRLTKK